MFFFNKIQLLIFGNNYFKSDKERERERGKRD